MMKVPYDSKEALEITASLQSYGKIIAYQASIELAVEKGCFNNFTDDYSKGNFFAQKVYPYLGSKHRRLYEEYGIRNSTLLTLPPVGTGSMLALNISSGGEPIYELENYRNILQSDGTKKQVLVDDYAWRLYCKLGKPDGEKPAYFKTAYEISPTAHIDMQATLQVHVDNSISKTCNLPNNVTFDEYKKLIMYAVNSKVKGFTTYRQGTREGVLLTKDEVENKPNASKVESHKETEPLTPRDRVLDGKTFKIKDPHGNVYVTCNYTTINGKRRPWEIFIFSSNENQEMYAALGKTLSAIMRRNDDISFIIDDLKSIKASSESGGYFTQEYGFVKSRPQHLSFILDEFINGLEQELSPVTVFDSKPKYKSAGEVCPDCGANLIRQGGCCQCSECSYSRCG